MKDNENMSKNEKRILSTVSKRLVKDYGYPVSLIEEDFVLSKAKKMADMVVFDSTKKDKILIVIEAKHGELVVQLGSVQLKQYMKLANAKYGILTNGTQDIFFENINNQFVQIADIPTKSKKTQITDLKPIPNPSNFLWQLFEQARAFHSIDEIGYELLKILVSKYVDEHDSHKINHLKKFSTEDDQENYLLFQDMWTFAKDKFPVLNDEEVRIDPKFATIICNTLKDFSVSKSNTHELVSTILMHSSNLKKGNGDPPQEIINLILELTSIKNDDSILVPFCGKGYTIFLLNELLTQRSNGKIKNKLVCIEPNRKRANQANMILILLGQNPSVVFEDPLESQSNELFDKLLFLNTPFGKKIDRNDFQIGRDYIDNVIFKFSKKVNFDGKIVALLPQGFLFDYSKHKIRNELLQNFYLHLIIKLPKGVLHPYSNVNTCIVVLEAKNTKSKIRVKNGVYDVFVAEFDGKYSKDIKIFENQFKKLTSDYNLFKKTNKIKNPGITGFQVSSDRLRYNWNVKYSSDLKEKLSTLKNPVRLWEVVEIIPGKAMLKKTIKEGSEIPYLRISDLKDKLIQDEISKKILVPKSKLEKSVENRIQPNDVIISCQATIGKTAIVTPKHKGAYLSPQLIALRTKGKILPEYLLNVLSLDSSQEQLRLMTYGAFIDRLSKKELKTLIIPLPSISDQKKSVQKFREYVNEIQSLEEKLDRVKSKLSQTGVEEIK